MLSAPSRLDFDLWPAASSRQLSAGSDLAQPSVLRLNKIIRHARDVIAYHPVQRLVARFFLVAGRELLGTLHEKPERLREHLFAFLLVGLERRAEIKVLVEKFLDLPALLFHLGAE